MNIQVLKAYETKGLAQLGAAIIDFILKLQDVYGVLKVVNLGEIPALS